MGVCRDVRGNLFPGAAMADAQQPISQHYREAAELPTVSFFPFPMIAWYPRTQMVLLGLLYPREN